MVDVLARRIGDDLRESRIDSKLALLMVPVAFLTYLFHECGHWTVGELLGNHMVLGLNSADVSGGGYAGPSDALLVSLGGPMFTLLQAFVAWLIVERTESMAAYPFLFFAAFCRFFSIVLGGHALQDEARIASLMHLPGFVPAIGVLSLLAGLVWRGTRVLKLPAKAVGYFTAMSTAVMLLVIAVVRLTG
jgi:hypothetical protein